MYHLGNKQKANTLFSMLMLDFVARHKIYPMIEEFPMTVEGLTEAFSKIEEGSVRYRAVLKAQDD